MVTGRSSKGVVKLLNFYLHFPFQMRVILVCDTSRELGGKEEEAERGWDRNLGTAKLRTKFCSVDFEVPQFRRHYVNVAID